MQIIAIHSTTYRSGGFLAHDLLNVQNFANKNKSTPQIVERWLRQTDTVCPEKGGHRKWKSISLSTSILYQMPKLNFATLYCFSEHVISEHVH